MDVDRARKAQERDVLRNLITQWNANRLDLFELSEPNEDLEFHGVMRFYFQDAGQKVATKCIRVSSTAVAQAVIKTLIEKFRPDMRMLSIPEYALYEIHENGEERKLGEEEKPLLVQLNWHKDDREGRFLLRRMDEKTYMTPQHFEDEVNFKRKLSKREKKEKKKKEKLQRLKENEENKDGLAERLYTELPETSFTRSISNPEAVMRRRRQQKLEKKLQQFRSRDGGPDSGGTLRIYGESLCKDVPYKTLLLSVRDNAAHVVKEMLNKYALDKEDPVNYCLVQSIAVGEGENKEYHGTSPGKEYILDDDECPLAILMNYQHPVCGSVTFHVRRRPADYQPRKRKKKPKPTHADGEYRYDDVIDRLPYLIELNPDGSEIVNSTPRRHHLHLNVTEVGSERAMSPSGQYLQLFGPNVQPRHCVVAHTDGIVTVTPCSRNAETYVHNQRIFETTILQHGMVVRFGKIHNFRFIDPMLEERRQRHESASGQMSDFQGDRHSTKDDSSIQASVLETTFDGDHVETVSTSSQKDDRRSEKSDKIKERPPVYDRYEHRRGHDPILPAVLEFREDGEEPFLRVIITNVEPNQVQFKLAPTYSLYMSARFRASTHYRPDITPTERAHRLTNLKNKVAAMIQHVIQEKYTDANSLAFWMANASELLHFLKQDRHVSAYTQEAQELLADSVQVAFRNLVQCLQADLQMIMPAFMDDRDDINEDEGTTAEFLTVLSAAMSLLRRCRVNAALTIQLFSQLFHFVNMWLFNKLVCENRPNYCTRLWGIRLKRRLARIELWAEKQGLELAADCHLSRVVQTAHLLQSPKSSADDIATISSTCFKLNSLQLRAVLEKYQPVMEEPQIPQELIENVVKVAENTADELARTDGREVRLEEDPDLQLPFLLPEDGYSCDIVRGVPAGLQEFLHPLQQAGLCRLTIQPTSSGYWTIYMSDQDITRATQLRSASSLGQHGGVSDLSRIGKEPEIAIIKLQKSNNGMGLSIVAAKGVGQEKLGIYIKSVVKGGAADADGRLQAGDQLLKVDGQSLVGITQEKAAEYMTRTGSVVTLEVAKQGAIYHGLATLLSQPSPIMQRASMRRAQAQTNNVAAFENNPSNPPTNTNVPNSHSSPSFFNHQPNDDPTNINGAAAIANNGLGYPSARRLSERDLPSRVSREPGADLDPRHVPRIQSSKSVPSLASGPQVQEPTRAPSSGNLKAPQEVFNPGYSRTSSTTSIVKAHEQVPPSRDGTIRSNGPMYGAENQRGRPVSQPNLQQQEERFYQNISLYQQKDPNVKISPQYAEYQQQQLPPSPKSPGAPYDDYNPLQPQQQLPPKPLPHDSYVPQQQAQPQQPAKPTPYDEYAQHPLPSPKLMPQGQYDDRFNRGMRGSQSSLHRTEPNSGGSGRERPMSVLVSQRERDQFMNNGPPGVQAEDRQQPAYHSMRQLDQNGKPYEPRSPTIQNGRYPDGYYGEDVARMDPRMVGPGGRPMGPVGMELPNGEPRRSEADYLRQQAKMEEMREEVRRREERNQRDLQARQTATWNGSAQHNIHASPQHQQQQPPMRPPQVHGNKLAPPSAYQQPPPQHMVDHHNYNNNFPPHGPYIAQGYSSKMPPPNLKPKPYVQGPEKPQRHYANEMQPGSGHPSNPDIPPERPPLPDEAHLYRDSPPPPPPPPVSTHPLVQQQQQQRSVSMQNGINYRYGPSDRQNLNDQYGPRSPVNANDARHQGRPPNLQPRVTFDTRSQDPASKSFTKSLETTAPMSPSPWEREEREKERKNRLADARRLRDQEIQALEACPYRTPKQEERMRTLRLEQEFQRRAEELKTNDDEDENEEDDDISERRGVLRMVQEDMERNRLRRLERENEERLRQQQQQMQQQQQQDNAFGRIDSAGHNHRSGTLGRPELPSSNHNTDDWLRRQQDIKNQRKEQREEEERQRQLKIEEDRIRQQKIEEVRRKREQEKAAMRELQAARDAEERLIREAQRRQEEDLKLRAMQQQHQQQQLQQLQQQQLQQQQLQQQQLQQQQLQQQQPAHYTGEYNHSPTSPGSYGSYPPQHPPSNTYSSSPSSGAAQRLDNLLTSGQPTYGHSAADGPTRTNSFYPGSNQQYPDKRHESENAVVSNSTVPPTNSVPRSAVSHSRNEAAPPKRVSFHDTKLETLCDDNDNDEDDDDENTRDQTNSLYQSSHNSLNMYNKEDPSVLLTPSNPQQHFSTGNSPGVIGAQEVYRDPRNKIQAQRQSQTPKLPGPEKLSFKEKMKMFALETGDTESPSDKVKISRAQREIETNINGS